MRGIVAVVKERDKDKRFIRLWRLDEPAAGLCRAEAKATALRSGSARSCAPSDVEGFRLLLRAGSYGRWGLHMDVVSYARDGEGRGGRHERTERSLVI